MAAEPLQQPPTGLWVREQTPVSDPSGTLGMVAGVEFPSLEILRIGLYEILCNML